MTHLGVTERTVTTMTMTMSMPMQLTRGLRLGALSQLQALIQPLVPPSGPPQDAKMLPRKRARGSASAGDEGEQASPCRLLDVVCWLECVVSLVASSGVGIFLELLAWATLTCVWFCLCVCLCGNVVALVCVFVLVLVFACLTHTNHTDSPRSGTQAAGATPQRPADGVYRCKEDERVKVCSPLTHTHSPLVATLTPILPSLPPVSSSVRASSNRPCRRPRARSAMQSYPIRLYAAYAEKPTKHAEEETC